MKINKVLTGTAVVLLAASGVRAQVYSPDLAKVGQPDTTNLKTLAAQIYQEYGAHTDREKAEAIWRYYLTDGRFVKPGIFYHLAGWAYEEPTGQVQDPVKLLNSYGYGLCYQDNPMLAATYKAGGFKDARVWFLTGHTVAEVFYDGQYHYFDSDMMGYNPVGSGPVKQRDVASVYQLEHDRNIILKNVTGPKTSNPQSVDTPWYPADVRAGAMGDLADLFSTTKDNYLYAYNRVPQGHTMDFVLRPGETMIRFFQPTPAGEFYLPHAFDGHEWKILPDLAQFHIPYTKGPHSEKDAREWATGRIEYRPAGSGDATVARESGRTEITFRMPSPYVIIDAGFSVQAALPDGKSRLVTETSTDGGHSWKQSGTVTGPFHGTWKSEPARIPTADGHMNAVSGSYGYQVRFTAENAGDRALSDFALTTVFQLNPRTLPAVTAGENEFTLRAGSGVRTELPVRTPRFKEFAAAVKNAAYEGEGGQGYIVNPELSRPGEIVYRVMLPGGGALSGFDAGGRFLDLSQGIAPNKFTAETRKVRPWPADRKDGGAASIAWSASENGPWATLWSYDPKLTWRDGQPIPQVLRWPEVDRSVRGLPGGTRQVYVRYRFDGLAVDRFRLAAVGSKSPAASEHLLITQIWEQDGTRKQNFEDIRHAGQSRQYQIAVPARAKVKNVAVVLACPLGKAQGKTQVAAR